MQNFITWVQKDEVEIKRELEQSEIDAVRIMTVHGSKGLQAPIVVLPDTVRVKQVKNEAGLLIDEFIYYPLGSADYEANCKNIKQKEKDASLEEYRRLLYVALTRAEERLCVCGYKKKNDISDESWYNLCKVTFAQIGKTLDDGSICYEVSQEVEPKEEKTKEIRGNLASVFDWLDKPAPVDAA